jgi:hypothetical protein
VQAAALLEGRLEGARHHPGDPTVDPPDQPLALQRVQVAADRPDGDAELGGQLVGADQRPRPDLLDDKGGRPVSVRR